jgi:hypothetical protein
MSGFFRLFLVLEVAHARRQVEELISDSGDRGISSMETTTFTALCERAGRWWTIRVPQVEGLTAQVRSLDQAEIVTRQLIARTLAIPAEAIRVDVMPDAPAPVAHALQVRHAARQALDAAAQATREALETLARDGVAVHDAATMLGLSPAEVSAYGPAAGGGAPEQPPAAPSPLLPAGQLSAWLNGLPLLGC